MSGITKKRLLEDVDGALIQIYEHPRGEIDVYNDEQLDELYHPDKPYNRTYRSSKPK